MLFQDLDFDKNIKKYINYDIVWKRPYQIVPNPVFIDDDISIDDLAQGMLGNCWLIATLNILVNDFDNFIQYLNPFQTFHKNVYTGKFSFNFVLNNVLTQIEIDDYLPTFENELIFCKNKHNKSEFWSSLFEKAVAKLLFNSYDKMDDGECLSKGLTLFNFKNINHLENIIDLKFDLKKNFYLLGSTAQDNSDQIVTLHAYALIDIKHDFRDGKKRSYLKIRNPYNNDLEYSKQIKLSKNDWDNNDGIFWMEMNKYFCHYFPHVLEISKDYNQILSNFATIYSSKFETLLESKNFLYIGINLQTIEKKNIQNLDQFQNELKENLYINFSSYSQEEKLFEYKFFIKKNKNIFFIQLNCEKLFLNNNNMKIILRHEIEHNFGSQDFVMYCFLDKKVYFKILRNIVRRLD